jgi:hypothetical protein
MPGVRKLLQADFKLSVGWWLDALYRQQVPEQVALARCGELAEPPQIHRSRRPE